MLNRPPSWTTFLQLCLDFKAKEDTMLNFNPSSQFVFNDISAFFTNIIKPMYPDFFILNQGMWTYKEFRSNVSHFNEIMQSAKESSPRFIWKTSTPKCYSPDTDLDGGSFRTWLQDAKVEVFDAFRITRNIAKAHRDGDKTCLGDLLHFQPFVYRELNKKLIDFLVNSPSIDLPLSRSQVCMYSDSRSQTLHFRYF